MRRFSFVPFLALAALLLFVPPQVRADGFNFVFTDVASDGSFSLVQTWQLPANPTPDVAISGSGFEIFSVTIDQVLNGVDQGLVPDAMVFVNPASLPFDFIDLYASLSGSGIMYSGDESNPTFTPGVYNGFDILNVDLNGNPSCATLTISTPEPASILMLLTGFLALAGALAVKKAAA